MHVPEHTNPAKGQAALQDEENNRNTHQSTLKLLIFLKKKHTLLQLFDLHHGTVAKIQLVINFCTQVFVCCYSLNGYIVA